MLTLVASRVAHYGLEAIFKEVIAGLRKKGKSKRDIRRELESYPLSRGLKRELLAHVDRA